MIKKVLSLLLVIIVIVTTIALPVDTKAQTIKEFEAEVEKYTKELEEKKNKIAKNEEEVASIKAKISNIESQIKQAEQDIVTLQAEIDQCNKDIEKKTEESKKILEYYQISNGNNIYLEYAFGATDITDMIYRMSIVEQLTEYNEQVMQQLEDLIKKNEQQQKDLEAKKVELNNLRKDLESQKERINADTASLREGASTIEDQIKSAKTQIQYLKDLGCGENETPEACTYRKNQSSGGSASIPSTNGFYRPIEYGYITQGYSGYGGHLGVDLGSSNKSIEIYPIANGLVTAKYYDNAGALVIKIRHNVGGSYIYSTYAHMRAWYVNIGQYVTENTVLGLMGMTGNATGPHLHLEITTCDWKSSGGGCTWAQYQRRSINPANYIALPSRWSNR